MKKQLLLFLFQKSPNIDSCLNTHSDDEERDLPTPVADMEKLEVDNDSKDDLTDWNQPVEEKSEDEQEIVVKNHPTLENYQLPSVNLLQDVPPTDQSEEKAEIQRNKKNIKQPFVRVLMI